MQLLRTRRRASVLGIAVALSTAMGTATHMAEAATWICVPETAGKAVLSGSSTTECKPANTKVELPPTAEMTVLNNILPHIKYIAAGIDGKPTIQFSGVNVQLVNGEGKTATTNGEGNLLIGYDEGPGTQTGSHNFVLGDGQAYTSYGGLVAGFGNEVGGPYATVSGGTDNTADEYAASVSGGADNTAAAEFSSVSGGRQNTTYAEWASISGGYSNSAAQLYTSVSGGSENTAEGFWASVSGGGHNVAKGFGSSVSGGVENETSSTASTVSGGEHNVASGEAASILGGYKNLAKGGWSAVYGGKEQTASKDYEAIG